MAFSNARALLVRFLLVLFVVTVVGIDDVVELADFVLEVVEAFLGFVEVGFWMWWLVSALLVAGSREAGYLSSCRAALGTSRDA